MLDAADSGLCRWRRGAGSISRCSRPARRQDNIRGPVLSRQRQRRRRRARVLRTASSSTASTTRGPRWASRVRTSRWTRFRSSRCRPRPTRPSTVSRPAALVDGRHQVGDQPAARIGPAVLPRRVDHGARSSSRRPKPDYRRYQYGGTIGGPIVKDKTHYFFAYEGTDENQFFTVNARGLWPQCEGTFTSAQTRWTYNAKVNHQISSGAEPVLPLRRGGRIPPDHHRRRPHRAERQLRLRGAAPIGRGRPFVGVERSHAERRPVSSTPTRSTRCRRPTATATGSRATSRRACRYCTPVFSYPSIQRRRLRQRADGPGGALGAEGRLLVPDAALAAARISGRAGVDFSYIPFEGDNTGSPLGSWTFPKDAPYDAERSRRPGRRSTRTRCRPTRTSRSRPSPAYVQDDWQAAQRPDASISAFATTCRSARSTRTSPDCSPRSRTSSAATAHSRSTSRSSRSRSPRAATATTSVRASAWPGIRRTTA